MGTLIRRYTLTFVVALVTAMATTSIPVVAATFDALNADKVDGRHAVGAGAKPAARAGKLVATNAGGRLPDNIIAKAPNADRLDGLDSTALQRRVTGACTAGQKMLAVRKNGTVACDADRINGGNAQTLDGIDSEGFLRKARLTLVVRAGADQVANGALLRETLSAIPEPGAGGPSGGAGGRWQLLLDPGIYDLGTQKLVTRSHVDIAGAGPRLTLLVCNCPDYSFDADPDAAEAVALAPEVELRDLAIHHLPTAEFGTPRAATGVRLAGGQSSLRNVAVFVGPTPKTTGLRVDAATLRVISSQVEVDGIGVPMGVWGTNSSATVYITDSEIIGPDAQALRPVDPAVDGTGDATFGVAHSLLEGSASGSATRCVGAYDATYVARTSTCAFGP